jgi:hypothetical protein
MRKRPELLTDTVCFAEGPRFQAALQLRRPKTSGKWNPSQGQESAPQNARVRLTKSASSTFPKWSGTTPIPSFGVACASTKVDTEGLGSVVARTAPGQG